MVWPLNPNTMLSMQPEKHKVLMPSSQLQRTQSVSGMCILILRHYLVLVIPNAG